MAPRHGSFDQKMRRLNPMRMHRIRSDLRWIAKQARKEGVDPHTYIRSLYS